jgi:hypothetical protein
VADRHAAAEVPRAVAHMVQAGLVRQAAPDRLRREDLLEGVAARTRARVAAGVELRQEGRPGVVRIGRSGCGSLCDTVPGAILEVLGQVGEAG